MTKPPTDVLIEAQEDLTKLTDEELLRRVVCLLPYLVPDNWDPGLRRMRVWVSTQDVVLANRIQEEWQRRFETRAALARYEAEKAGRREQIFREWGGDEPLPHGALAMEADPQSVLEDCECPVEGHVAGCKRDRLGRILAAHSIDADPQPAPTHLLRPGEERHEAARQKPAPVCPTCRNLGFVGNLGEPGSQGCPTCKPTRGGQ